MRTEATGYGVVYFAENMLHTKGDSLRGKTCLVSGSGNVAQYTIEKLIDFGAKVLTASDSNGFILDEEGINTQKLEFIKDLKNNRRGRISEYAIEFKGAKYVDIKAGSRTNPLWDIKASCAFPCATQNEINKTDAENLVRNGLKLLVEGANMPTTIDGINILLDGNVMYAPGKASNAGGVATSGIEMTQNYIGQSWTRQEVDARLQAIMKGIHDSCLHHANDYGQPGNYLVGANVAGFLKVANAMKAQGII